MTCEYSDITCEECCDTGQYYGCLMDTRDKIENTFPSFLQDYAISTHQDINRLEKSVARLLDYSKECKEFVNERKGDACIFDTGFIDDKYNSKKLANLILSTVFNMVKDDTEYKLVEIVKNKTNEVKG